MDKTNEYAEKLFETGVVVIPLFDKKEIIEWNTQFKETLQSFREYLNPTLDTIYVFGTLGSLGNPSSFHNIFVRRLRMKLMFLARSIFKSLEELRGGEYRNLEQLFDRMTIRRKGTKTQPESWHRDIYPNPTKGDDIFGGWVNFDIDGSQYFSCVPKTHKDQTTETGFSKIKQDDAEKYEKTKQRIEIPPGHWVIFYQQIVHEILPRKMSYDSYRTYTGFRLTKSTDPLYNHQQTIQDQGVPKYLPGGVPIKMYADLNTKFHLYQLIEWSKIFKAECLQQKINKKTGNTYLIVDQRMKSLKEYGFLQYPAYSLEEINIMNPQKL